MGIFGLGVSFLLAWLGNYIVGEMRWIYILIVIFVYGLICIAWGTAASSVIENKGYKDAYHSTTKWFFVGLIFNEIGFAFACAKPDIRTEYLVKELERLKKELEEKSGVDPEASEAVKKVLPNGEWRCSCGRSNSFKVTKCLCGNKKPVPTVKKETEDDLKDILSDGEWKCSCGRINPSYVTTCLCGAEKDVPLFEDKTE